jgi:hypothetical protein
MTGHEEPLTPQQEEVRRLLAGARHTGTTPPEVVARLEATLEDLAREPDRKAPVVDLARRRRRVASLLVAAAAVVVVGIAVSQVVTPEPASESALSGDSAEDSVSSRSAQESEPKAQSPLDSAEQNSPLSDTDGLFAVRRDHLADDLADARRQSTASGFSHKADSADRAAGTLCSADAWGRGRFVPVRYGRTPAVLVFRRPRGETQVVDLFLCGSEQPERSVTLPAP